MSGESGRKKRWRLSTAALVGLVALASGVVTLAFTLSPSLKPDPGNAVNATVEVLTVESHAHYKAYLRRLGDAAPRVKDPEVLKEIGFIVNLKLQINGRKRHDVSLWQAPYVAGSGRRLEDALKDLTFRSETPSDTWVAPVFVVEQDFPTFTRFELRDGNVILAVDQTPTLGGDER